MNQNNFNSWEDFFRFCGASSNNSSNNNSTSNNGSSRCENCKPGNGQGEASERARNADSDIPGGFQDIPPQLLLVIGELLGNVIAGNLPSNMQNIVGNWLQLVGQIIEVFNAQQQYYQAGPGRYYNYIYRNVANPFCTNEVDETQTNIVVDGKEPRNTRTSDSEEKQSKREKTSRKNNNLNEINELRICISNLCKEIDELKKEIYELKKKT